MLTNPTTSPVPWFRVLGTAAFWHPAATGVFGGSTTTSTSSYFKYLAGQAGKPGPGARVWLTLDSVPVSPLNVICKVIPNDESSATIREFFLGSNSGLGTMKGPIDIPPATYTLTDANEWAGGFCVQVTDQATPGTPLAATYIVTVHWMPIAPGTAI